MTQVPRSERPLQPGDHVTSTATGHRGVVIISYHDDGVWYADVIFGRNTHTSTRLAASGFTLDGDECVLPR